MKCLNSKQIAVNSNITFFQSSMELVILKRYFKKSEGLLFILYPFLCFSDKAHQARTHGKNYKKPIVLCLTIIVLILLLIFGIYEKISNLYWTLRIWWIDEEIYFIGIFFADLLLSQKLKLYILKETSILEEIKQ